MPAGKRETVVEQSSFSGSVSPTYQMGASSYGKYFDNTSGKWERWSGSEAPYIRFIPSLEDAVNDSLRVSIVSGDIELGTIGITGSIGLSVTGSNTIGDIGKSITGSIGLSITGSSATLPVSLVGTAVSGSVGITGSATLPMSLVGTAVSGSVGITGSETLNVNVVSGTFSGSVTVDPNVIISGSNITLSVSGSVDSRQSGSWNLAGGSIGITGSATLPVSLVGTTISGSVGLTGSATLPVQGSVNITGSTFFAPISKLDLFNTGSTANTPILATALTPTNTPCIFIIYACFASGSTFLVLRTKGGVTGSEYMNSYGTLTTSGSYMFDIVVNTGDAINFAYETGSTIITLSVIEKDGV